MTRFDRLPREELSDLRRELAERYEAFRARGLTLDITRGNPCRAQLDLANGLLDAVNASDHLGEGGADYRGYGGVDGIPEAKRLFAELMGVDSGQVVVGGNASVRMMHDRIRDAMIRGLPGGETPWMRLPAVKFLCPVPGYDRHFNICRYFDVEMVPVEMTDTGPDVEQVERLVASDPAVRGMWCVPRYANPTGATCSDEVVRRLAAMPAAAPDFRIFFDDAYCVHHLGEGPEPLLNPLEACRAAGNPDRALLFCSTSKISFAGAGVAAMAASEDNIHHARANIELQMIGPDKLNQLRHVRWFGDRAGVLAHMDRHAAILRPKFEAVQAGFERELGGKGVAEWTRPRGGYFVSLDVPDGGATEVVRLAGEAGVRLTPAGATFPYGRDPRDRNIRIAPTFPEVPELELAVELVGVCVQMVAADRLLLE